MFLAWIEINHYLCSIRALYEIELFSIAYQNSPVYIYFHTGYNQYGSSNGLADSCLFKLRNLALQLCKSKRSLGAHLHNSWKHALKETGFWLHQRASLSWDNFKMASSAKKGMLLYAESRIISKPIWHC